MILDPKRALPVLQAALKEDLGTRDLTTATLIPLTATAQAELVTRTDGVIAGVPLIAWTYGLLSRDLRVKPMVKDGDAVHAGKAVAFLEGPARPLLSGERTVLNVVSRLSGIATLTRAFVERVRPYPAKILDTRKTTPNLRYLEKYAVAVGGGHNHRMGLYDQVLIKDNHLQTLAGAKTPRAAVIPQALAKVRRVGARAVKVEIEVRDLEELRAALGAGATLILLDHMPVATLREAMRLARRAGRSAEARGSASASASRKVWVEASGGITLETVAQVAATGVDYISVGAITRDAPGLDLALEVV